MDTAASDIGIEVRVIFFVRDALPYCLSAYDQGIKEGWITTQFADNGLTAEWLHPKALRNLVGVFPPSRLRVLHYESERQNLLRAFFRAVGVSSPLISPLGSEIGFLNRSLTRETRDLLLQINQDQNNRIFSEVLNHGLQAAYPDASAERLPIPTDLMEKLSDRFAGDVDWINKTFFQGARIVGLGAETSRVGQGKFSEKQLKRSLQVHKTGLEIILKKSTGMLEKFHDRIIYRVLTLDRENLVDPEHCTHDAEDGEWFPNGVDKTIRHRVVDDSGIRGNTVVDVRSRTFLKECDRKFLGFFQGGDLHVSDDSSADPGQAVGAQIA